MPPKQKYTREEIIETSLEIAKQHGISGITARGLGVALGTSSRPIFTAFQNMEEVQQETIIAAKAVYNEYVKKGLAETPAFKGVGMQYIQFAKDEPKLFQMLFMNRELASSGLSDILPAIDDNSNEILGSIQNSYAIGNEDAFKLYQQLWLFTHGIATLYATEVCWLSENEVSEMLTNVFVGLLRQIKEKSEAQQ